MDVREKQKERRNILSVLPCEFQELTIRGGVNTGVIDNVVVLTCFIQYIIGGSKCYNVLCGHNQTGCWSDKDSLASDTSIGPGQFDRLTLQDMADGDPTTMDSR